MLDQHISLTWDIEGLMRAYSSHLIYAIDVQDQLLEQARVRVSRQMGGKKMSTSGIKFYYKRVKGPRCYYYLGAYDFNASNPRHGYHKIVNLKKNKTAPYYSDSHISRAYPWEQEVLLATREITAIYNTMIISLDQVRKQDKFLRKQLDKSIEDTQTISGLYPLVQDMMDSTLGKFEGYDYSVFDN